MRTVRISKEMMEAAKKMIVTKKAQKKEEKREERKGEKAVKRINLSLKAVTRAIQLGYKKCDIHNALGCTQMGLKLFLRRHGWEMPALKMPHRPIQPLTKELLNMLAIMEAQECMAIKIANLQIAA